MTENAVAAPGDNPAATTVSSTRTASELAQESMRIATWFLVCIYCLPLVLVLVSSLATNLFVDQSKIILPFFIGLATSPNDPLGIIHRVLLPIIGGFAPLAFANERSSKQTTWLILVLIAGIATSVFLSAVFDSQSVQNSLKTHSLLGEGSADSKLVSSYFLRTQEVLGIYVMLLFGLKLERAVR